FLLLIMLCPSTHFSSHYFAPTHIYTLSLHDALPISTPMKYRKDAGVATAEIINNIHKNAVEHGEPLVATVGSVEFTPGTVNVVPGHSNFSIDVRHTQKEDIISFTENMEKMMKDVAEKAGLGIEINLYMDEDPVPMSQDIVDVIS